MNRSITAVLFGLAVLMLAVPSSSRALVSGSAPWCTVDGVGNYTCMYFTLSSCEQAAKRLGQACYPNPNPKSK